MMRTCMQHSLYGAELINTGEDRAPDVFDWRVRAGKQSRRSETAATTSSQAE
jgi:hypothetical protein